MSKTLSITAYRRFLSLLVYSSLVDALLGVAFMMPNVNSFGRFTNLYLLFTNMVA